MKFSEQDMAALISEVEAQFSEHLAKAEASNEEETMEKSEEEVATEEVAAAPADESGEEIKKSEEEVSEESFDYDDEDIAEMDKMYASMTKSEAQAHFDSIQRALGVESSEETVEEEQVIAKSEEVETEDKEDGTELLKSERDSLQKENEELKKSLETLTAAMTKYVKGASAPKQKAITRLEYIAKSEDGESKKEDEVNVEKLTKSEIKEKLTQKIREGKLEKSDKEKINQYYLDSSNANIETIKHLLV